MIYKCQSMIRPLRAAGPRGSPMRRQPRSIRLVLLLTFCLAATPLLAWTNGELLIWVDAARGRTLEPIAQRFESDFGIKATIEAPEKITDIFPLAAQVA